MGIIRTVEWKLRCDVSTGEQRVLGALTKLDLSPTTNAGHIHGSAKRSWTKNRWAAEVDVEISSLPDGALAVCRVDMAGDKHYEIAIEIAEAIGDDVIDDRGVTAAIQRLGKVARLSGRSEVRHLRNVTRHNEQVLELAQGIYAGKQGLAVLTDRRMFFLEKSMGGNETIEEFELSSISSISIIKKMTGETLRIHTSGNSAEIKGMGHGQADALARAYRTLKDASRTSLPVPEPASNPAVVADPITQLERLASLRDSGIITEEEFQTKKRDIIARL